MNENKIKVSTFHIAICGLYIEDIRSLSQHAKDQH